jgi:transposase
MVRPYSNDLRARVVDDVAGGGTIRGVAARFGVSPSFVSKLHSRYRRTGSVEPDKQGGDHRSHRIEAQGEWILDRVAAAPDITQDELRRGLADRGLSVSCSTVWRFFKRHRMSLKKRPRTPPSRSAPT